MAIRIYYGEHIFETEETDANTMRGDLYKALDGNPNGGALWKLKTADGFLHLMVTRTIPIAIAEYEKPVQRDRHVTVL